MTQQLFISIEELIESPWEEIMFYHLQEEQREVLLSSQYLSKEKCVFRPREKFGQRIQEKPEIALVLEGMIVYKIVERIYYQKEDDIMVLPSGILHCPTIGPQGCTAYALYKNPII